MNQKISTKSSKILSDFLDKNNLHKKDFAQMIGVTLSYVYNLIDNSIPFSTRSTTLERIATVMEVEPEIFEEYRLPQEPIIIDDTVLKIKNELQNRNIKTLDFLKSFPRNKRLDIVDILRGAIPIPLDYNELSFMGNTIGISQEEIFEIWESRFKQALEISGMNIYSNSKLINSMLDCAREFVSEDK